MSDNRVQETPKTGESFLPFSRGFREYQKVYSPVAQALYLWILQGADWRPGPDYGVLECTLLEMREGVALARKTVQAGLRELARGYPFPVLSRTRKDTAPAFIRILSVSKRGRETLYRIQVLKAKLRFDHFEKFGENGKKRPGKSVGEKLEEKIIGGQVREIKDLVGNIAAEMDVKKLLGGKK